MNIQELIKNATILKNEPVDITEHLINTIWDFTKSLENLTGFKLKQLTINDLLKLEDLFTFYKEWNDINSLVSIPLDRLVDEGNLPTYHILLLIKSTLDTLTSNVEDISDEKIRIKLSFPFEYDTELEYTNTLVKEITNIDVDIIYQKPRGYIVVEYVSYEFEYIDDYNNKRYISKKLQRNIIE